LQDVTFDDYGRNDENFLLQDLLPPEHQQMMPDLVLARETAAFLELSPEEAERLKNFPNIVSHYEYGPLDGTYILPPITYPDGKTYLKVPTHFDLTLSESVYQYIGKSMCARNKTLPLSNDLASILLNCCQSNNCPPIP
jgi:hypothetical protein